MSRPPGSGRAVALKILSALEGVATQHRLATNLVAHILIFTVALLLAFLVWFDTGAKTQQSWFYGEFLYLLPFFIVCKLLSYWWFRLLRVSWQWASIRDIFTIIQASLAFLAVAWSGYAMSIWLPRTLERVPIPYLSDYFARFPNGVMALDFLMTVFLVSAARLGFRLYREELRPVSAEGFRRVLVVGAGNAAETIVREINRMPVERFRVVGFVDDDPAKQGIFIHGLPVLGKTDDLAEVCQEEEVEEIIIAMPSATRKELSRVIAMCSGTKLKFQSLPGMGDLLDGRVTVSQIRPVEINDLLGREAVTLDTEAVSRFIGGRVVLITGAGGSIGSEMSRQVCQYGPAKLILLEQAENPLFDIEGELRGKFPSIPLAACICDIYDRQRVFAVWNEYRPEVVIHAAAHKHVPLMEHNPCEAVKNNILGTRNVADASCASDVDEFVMISTDKAVNPSSVMGASKRAAEIYTQSLNGRDGCRTQFKAVRFGNVLGSAGSVVPTFRKQIAAGGPVRVTHPEMTRYFMTIPEASQLVLQAAAMGAGGQIFLLDMGEPVKIVDLAKQMITLSGFRPGEDIEIVFSGVRPGEKLFEELRTEGENIEPTVHPKILVWKSRPVAPARVSDAMTRFVGLAGCLDREPIVVALRDLIPEYQPLNAPTPAAEAGEATAVPPARR